MRRNGLYFCVVLVFVILLLAWLRPGIPTVRNIAQSLGKETKFVLELPRGHRYNCHLLLGIRSQEVSGSMPLGGCLSIRDLNGTGILRRDFETGDLMKVNWLTSEGIPSGFVLTSRKHELLPLDKLLNLERAHWVNLTLYGSSENVSLWLFYVRDPVCR